MITAARAGMAPEVGTVASMAAKAWPRALGGRQPVRHLPPALDLDAIPLAAHEAAMRLAIAAAKANPFYPFGAVIIGAADRATLAQGVDDGKANPIFHGEIAAINDYVAATATKAGPTASYTPPASPARCA
jgi:hypothetical protein